MLVRSSRLLTTSSLPAYLPLLHVYPPSKPVHTGGTLRKHIPLLTHTLPPSSTYKQKRAFSLTSSPPQETAVPLPSLVVKPPSGPRC